MKRISLMLMILVFGVSIIGIRIPLVQTSAEQIAVGEYPGYLCYDLGYIYFSEYGHSPGHTDGTVKRVPAGGGTVDTLVSPVTTPTDIAFDSEYIYYIAHDAGRIMRINKTDLTEETFKSGLSRPCRIVVYLDSVYFTERDGNRLWRIFKDTKATHPNYPIAADHPCGLVLDLAFVYFSEYTAGNIKKVPLEGGAPVTVASGLNPNIDNIAMDSDYIYFSEYAVTSPYLGRVGRVSKNGGAIEILAEDQKQPYELVVYDDFVYFAEVASSFGTEKGTIKKVPKGGGTVETIVSDLNRPNSVCVESDYLYFAENYPSGRIYRLSILCEDFELEPLIVAPYWDDSSSMFQDSTCKIWVFYGSKSLSYPYSRKGIFYITSTDMGNTWSDPTELMPAHEDAPEEYPYPNWPSAFQDSTGKIWVAWNRWTAPSGGDIYYTTSTDGGVTWSSREVLAAYPGDDNNGCFIEVEGRIWHFFSPYSLSSWDVHYTVWLDDHWSAPIPITDDPEPHHFGADAIVDSTGTVWVTYERGHGGGLGDEDIWYKTSSDNGATWSPGQRITYTAGSENRPRIVEYSGIIYIFYYTGEQPAQDVWCVTSTDYGTTWSALCQLTTDPSIDCHPWPSQIDTQLWFAWTTRRSGDYDVWLAKKCGDWNHRKIVIVDNSENPETLTDFQVFLNVTYDSNMQPDFDDLRFTWYNETSGEEVDIDYWLDKYIDSEYALVWVEVPLIEGLGQEVLYMYYGNPCATSESSGEATFDFFDGFSTDTTSNYEISRNPNGEISWDPNGWLIFHTEHNFMVRHRTAQIYEVEERFWIETKGKALGEGVLDYFGVMKDYKHAGQTHPNHYSAMAVIREIPYNSCRLTSTWESFAEFSEHEAVPATIKEKWYRIGLGTSSEGTVFGRFYDDDYNRIRTIDNQTVHSNNEWWISLVGSKEAHSHTDLYVYFDYLRVRKFADPEPTCSIVRYSDLISEYFPYWKFSKNEQYYPCSFYFDDDPYVTNNYENYKDEVEDWNVPYVYIHVAEDEYDITIEYWLYYAFNDHPHGSILDHEHDWDSTVSIVFEKENLNKPRVVYFFSHWHASGFRAEPILWEDVPHKDCGKHVIAYVANGSHGAYPSPDQIPWYDLWAEGGEQYEPEDFNWIIAEECEHEKDDELCWVPHATIGVPQNEPAQGYWPHYYPYTWVVFPRKLTAPWHRSEWNKGMFSTLTLEINPSTVKRFETVTFSGGLIPEIINTQIRLEYRSVGEQGLDSWKEWKRVRTDSDGYFSKSFLMNLGSGSYEFRARWLDTLYNIVDPPAVSHIVMLTIT